jgi:enoyl-CoA hydratase
MSRVDAELLVETDGAVATFTLNRPERLNAITPTLINALDAALADALADAAVRVIRLRGAGRAFCAGYDLEWDATLMHEGDLAGPWDPAADYRTMSRYVNSYMALWRSPKPVVAQVHGACVGGGSDLALCSDLIVCAEDALIGYPPARVWGSPTTAMWFHRLGLERAKRLLLTGDPMDGRTAAEWGFASGAYPAEKLDEAALALCRRIARIPANQLQFMKMLVNTAVEQQGLAATQMLGTLLDGAARHTPEGTAFSRDAAADVKAAVRARDEPFGDYGFGSRTVADPLA